MEAKAIISRVIPLVAFKQAKKTCRGCKIIDIEIALRGKENKRGEQIENTRPF